MKLTDNGEKIDLSGIQQSTGTENAQKIADSINNNTNLQGKVSAEVKDGKPKIFCVPAVLAGTFLFIIQAVAAEDF